MASGPPGLRDALPAPGAHVLRSTGAVYMREHGIFELISRSCPLCVFSLPPGSPMSLPRPPRLSGVCAPVCVEVPSETEAVQGNAMKLRCISCMKREEVEASTVVEWFYRPEGGKDFLVRGLLTLPPPRGLCGLCLGPGGGGGELTDTGPFSLKG